MRLPVNRDKRIIAIGLTAFFVTATAGLTGAALARSQPHLAPAMTRANDPSADYPVVVGDPYVVGQASFTPSDAMNYDAVGVASVGPDGGTAVSAAHHTLPVPSYIEVTSLDSGKTILVRVDRRGPMDAANLLQLSPGAAAQLGLAQQGGAVRVRRVNPPESERAMLRAGGTAPERIATPKALLAVLARKLGPDTTPLATASAPAHGPDTDFAAAAPAPVSAAPIPARARLQRAAVGGPAANAGASFAGGSLDNAFAPADAPAAPAPAQRKPHIAAAPQPATVASAPAKLAAGGLVVQAGAFSVKGNAEALASKLGANVDSTGKLWRVRVGPFARQAEAEAALAKVKAAGYMGARIQRSE
jgi:rare lipoprotein A